MACMYVCRCVRAQGVNDECMHVHTDAGIRGWPDACRTSCLYGVIMHVCVHHCMAYIYMQASTRARVYSLYSCVRECMNG